MSSERHVGDLGNIEADGSGKQGKYNKEVAPSSGTEFQLHSRLNQELNTGTFTIKLKVNAPVFSSDLF